MKIDLQKVVWYLSVLLKLAVVADQVIESSKQERRIETPAAEAEEGA